MSMMTPTRTTLTGTTVLMACACGAGSSSAKLLQMGGMNVTSRVTHSLFLTIGAVLVVAGLRKILPQAFYLSLAAFAVLAVAATLTPPSVMSVSRMPWHGVQILGAFLYFVFAALLVRAFWLAFPSANPRASATALAGTAVATGCSCCMVTGATAGLIVTAGGSTELFQAHSTVYLTGLAIMAFGLVSLARVRPLPWLAAGALVTLYGGNLLKLAGDWMVGDVNMRFIPGYMMYLIGAGLVVKAFAVAYEPARSFDEQSIADAAAQPA